MSEVLPVAERILSQHRRLRPFGCTLSSDDHLAQVGAAQHDVDFDGPALVAEFRSTFRDGATRAELKASALVYTSDADGSAPGSQVVRVELDHRENYSLVVSFPYRFSSAGELTIDEPFGAEGAHEIFEG